MSETPSRNTEHPQAQPIARHRDGGQVLRRLVLILVALVVLGVAGGVSAYWILNRPKASRRPPQRKATLVTVEVVRSEEERVTIRAMGTVVPARSVELSSRVSGEIVHVSPMFIPGGRFETGELMLKVDPEDFELAVRLQKAQSQKASAEVDQAASAVAQREADFTRAESQLSLEMGNQSVAEREYQLMGETVVPGDEALLLRQPQLKQAQADCLAAEASKRAAEAFRHAAQASEAATRVALEQAQLDLKRTVIRTPFNAMIRSRNVDLGAQVAIGASLASLVDTDEYWVEVSAPVDELKWISVPGFNNEVGSSTRIYHAGAWGPDTHRAGVVKRLMSEIEPEGRMARLLVAVKDPLELNASPQVRRPLILGAYVRVEIDGRTLTDVVRVERPALRNGDQVWVMGQDDTLELRQVRIVWADNTHVYVVEGLDAGDRLVTSDLGVPVEGMPLRTVGSSAPPAPDRPQDGPRAGRPHNSEEAR